MNKRKAILRLLIGICLILSLSYHICTIAYINNKLYETRYFFIGFEVNTFILIDVSLFCLLGVLLILLVIIE